MRSSVPALIRRLGDPAESPAARSRAAAALAAIGEAAVDPLCLCLGEGDATTRGQAAEILGTIGAVRAVDYLLGAVVDGDWAVRQSVVTALGRFDDPRIVQALCGALGDDHPSVRVAAADALRPLADVRAVYTLIGAAHDRDPDLRRAAARSLDALGPAATLPDRVLACAAMSPAERRTALEAMRAFRMDLAGGRLEYPFAEIDRFCRGRLRHASPEVRRGAREILDCGTLLRPAAPAGGANLLRPAGASQRPTDADSLLRPVAEEDQD